MDCHKEFAMLDGLAYRARHNNGQVCYALFDRVDVSDLTPTSRLDFEAPDRRRWLDKAIRAPLGYQSASIA
jgi:hypothetical protein